MARISVPIAITRERFCLRIDPVAHMTGIPLFCATLSCGCGQRWQGGTLILNYPCATRGRVRAGISGIRQLTT